MQNEETFSRLLKIQPHKSCFLFGPRGTGKTWWLRHHFPQALYFDLLESRLYLELLAHPERLEELIPPDHHDWIIIDEVQKIPQLLNEVHRLIEKRHFNFILTGSSARSLRKKGVNLLAGRALTYQMHPLTRQELGAHFNLEFSLKYGQLPSVYTEQDPLKYLTSYIHTYLREEVQQEGFTRNLAGFARFLEVASLSQGQVINMSEIAREVALQRKTVESFFSIAEDLMLAYSLPIFTRRAKRRLIAHSKFYYFDVGIFRSLRPMGPLDSPTEIEGAALESLLLQEIKALNDYLALDYQIYFWRTSHQVEVDFVLYGPKGLLAIEVKRSENISKQDLQGLLNFGSDYPEAELLLFYGGKQREYRQNIRMIPYMEALNQLPQLLHHTQDQIV